MPVFKINRRNVSALKPSAKPIAYYDENPPGFGIRVRPTGASSWFIEYRPGASGRSVAKRRMVIGTPATLSPEKARAEAERLLAQVKLGADPGAARSEARKAETVNDLIDHYLNHHVKAKRKADTVDIYTGFAKHLRAAMGTKAAPALSVSDMRRFHWQVGKSHPVTANRAVALLSTVLCLCNKDKSLTARYRESRRRHRAFR